MDRKKAEERIARYLAKNLHFPQDTDEWFEMFRVLDEVSDALYKQYGDSTQGETPEDGWLLQNVPKAWAKLERDEELRKAEPLEPLTDSINQFDFMDHPPKSYSKSYSILESAPTFRRQDSTLYENPFFKEPSSRSLKTPLLSEDSTPPVFPVRRLARLQSQPFWKNGKKS